MRVLTTRAHGALDYAVAAVLVVLPFVGGFADGPAGWVPIGVGAALAASGLATDYELGVLKRLQPVVHLWIDAFLGALLAVSPWLFAFDERVWLPHLLAGLVLVGAAVFTDTIPGYERRRAPRSPAA